MVPVPKYLAAERGGFIQQHPMHSPFLPKGLLCRENPLRGLDRPTHQRGHMTGAWGRLIQCGPQPSSASEFLSNTHLTGRIVQMATGCTVQQYSPTYNTTRASSRISPHSLLLCSYIISRNHDDADERERCRGQAASQTCGELERFQCTGSNKPCLLERESK